MASGPSPIRPGETIRQSIAEFVERSGSVPQGFRVTLVVFDDGTFEGSPERFDHLLAQRRSAAGDAAYWLATIDALPQQPPGDVSAYLWARLNARAEIDRQAGVTLQLFGMDRVLAASRSDLVHMAGIAAGLRAPLTETAQRLATRLDQMAPLGRR